MSMCDQQGENWFQWYRGAFVDVSPAEDNLMLSSLFDLCVLVLPLFLRIHQPVLQIFVGLLS